jgi:Fic family protein
MKFPPTFTITDKCAKSLYALDILKSAYQLHPLPEKSAAAIRRQSILKSSLFSARIEGNPMTLEEVNAGQTDENDLHLAEIGNIVSAYSYLDTHKGEPVTKTILTDLHRLVMQGISPSAGHFRTEDSAIFNQAGVAVYLAPAPAKIPQLLDRLISWCNDNPAAPPVAAAVTHIWFEKIHPFEDGNGRVGRLISTLILKKSGSDFGGIVPFEEYLDNHRQAYYDALGKDVQDVTRFVEFFLDALITQARQSLQEASNPPEIKYPNLLPRRAEIMEILHDHRTVSFDFLARRFRKIPTRTLHYDLEQLVKAGLVKKLGSTRGAVYTSNERT